MMKYQMQLNKELACISNYATEKNAVPSPFLRTPTLVLFLYYYYINFILYLSFSLSFPKMQDDRLIAECRVRYLSFLGIGKNVKNCAFIMHTAQDKFICHVFLCEPSSGALCKTIEAACKVNDTISNRRFRR